MRLDWELLLDPAFFSELLGVTALSQLAPLCVLFLLHTHLVNRGHLVSVVEEKSGKPAFTECSLEAGEQEGFGARCSARLDSGFLNSPGSDLCPSPQMLLLFAGT